MLCLPVALFYQFFCGLLKGTKPAKNTLIWQKTKFKVSIFLSRSTYLNSSKSEVSRPDPNQLKLLSDSRSNELSLLVDDEDTEGHGEEGCCCCCFVDGGEESFKKV